MSDSLRSLILSIRTPLVLSLNLGITVFCFVLAMLLRFDFAVPLERITFERFFFPLILLLVFRATTYSWFKLNSGYWRFVSTSEAVDLLKATAFSSLLLIASLAVFRLDGFPRSVVFIEFVLSLLLGMGARLGVRLLMERYQFGLSAKSSGRKDVVIIGGGVSGHLLVKAFRSLPEMPYRATAVLDDSIRLKGGSLHGVKIVGPISSLGEYLERAKNVGTVILAIRQLSPAKRRSIEEACAQFHIPLKRLQSFEDIACSAELEPSTGLSIEQMLSKEENPEHEADIRAAITGRRVLITGAGGSIGSELVRQVIAFEPSEVLLVEKSEYNLFSIEQELRGRGENVKKEFLLANITNHARLDRLFQEHKPQIVFHAAAYKHVPLLEANCYEAFLNNIIGTRNVLDAAEKCKAERFVLISTDKAVDPSSVMGSSKRVAELMVAQKNLSDGNLRTSIVRFGNVINSAGSVIPLFKQQILSGGPITVTHPDMERYFMSIREAVRLVLTAGTFVETGETYLLDMGQPIKIVDVAKKLLALYGRRDISIVFSGLRPGEKLTEQLYSDSEERENTELRKIFRVKSKNADSRDVFDWVQAVEAYLDELDNGEVELLIRSFVSGRTELHGSHVLRHLRQDAGTDVEEFSEDLPVLAEQK